VLAVVATVAVMAPPAVATAARTAASGTGGHATGRHVTAVGARARANPIKAGTPLGCLVIGGLINAHRSGRVTWEGFDEAYAEFVSVRGPYNTTAGANSVARADRRGGFAETAKRYVVSAPMGRSMAPQVKTVTSCLKERVHVVGYGF
jgi:hypothetical protein